MLVAVDAKLSLDYFNSLSTVLMTLVAGALYVALTTSGSANFICCELRSLLSSILFFALMSLFFSDCCFVIYCSYSTILGLVKKSDMQMLFQKLINYTNKTKQP